MATSTEIDSLKFWYDQLATRSYETRKVYTIYFNNFLRHSGLTPNQLIELQRKAMASNGDPREDFVVETEVRRWLAGLQKVKSPATCRSALSAVKSFFNSNLHPLRLNRFDNPQGDSQGSRIPEKSEVVQIADAAKSKYRAAIMFLKDSGLRISDAVSVKWEDLKDLGEGFWHFKIVTRKRGVAACCFLGPETTRLLNQFPTKTGRIFHVKPHSFDVKLNRIIARTGIDGVSAHGLRKYYKTCLEHARTPENYILHMMGKKSSVYSEKRVSELFRAYKKAYPELRLFTEQKQTEEIEKLKKRIHELERLRLRTDKVMEDIEALMSLPGGREMFEEVVDTAKKQLVEQLKKHKLYEGTKEQFFKSE